MLVCTETHFFEDHFLKKSENSAKIKKVLELEALYFL